MVAKLIKNKKSSDEMSFIDYFKMIYAFIVALAFPILVTLFLVKKKQRLLDEDFMGSYGTLYGNLRIFKMS